MSAMEEAMEVAEEVIDEFVEAFKKVDAENEKRTSVWEGLLAEPRVDEEALKVKEKCIYKLVQLHAENKQFTDVMSMLQKNNDFFSVIPKAKTAKIVRNILNIIAKVPDSMDAQISLCHSLVEWCKAEKRTFLRQRIEGRLATLLLSKNETLSALTIVNELLKELKKLDDKQMLTEIHLTESRIYHALQNVPKAKASLTAARTAANAIYVVPLLQAELDEMSGALHCEDRDYTTAYSYFLEALDAYDQNGSKRAVMCLKYMCLCKVLNNCPNEVPSILSGKLALKHQGPDVQAMAQIAKAANVRSLEDFTAAVKANEALLKSDALISHHLDVLYENMLEGNLLKIIHPFSCVELDHISKLINLPVKTVEKKLSQMILDHRFSGILDQGKGHLIVYESTSESTSFTHAVDIIGNVGLVVEVLASRAKGLHKRGPSATPVAPPTATAK